MKIAIRLALPVLAMFFAVDASAQEFRLTTSKSNLVASKATIEVPALSGNPEAIIVATPLGETATLNSHPIGAWYYNGKWNVFNTDHSTMPEGLNYKIEYFLRRDEKHFLHVMTKANITGRGSVIDNPVLNNSPNAQFTIFQNHAPDNRTGSLNKYAAKPEYDTASGKWSIVNINGERLFPDTAYNVVITSVGTPGSNSSIPVGTPFVPAAPMTFAVAPMTVVARVEWPIPYQGNILLSSGLCKIVYGAYTNTDVLATDTVIVTGQASSEGAYLKWTAVADNGAVHLNVCNWKKMTLAASAAMDLNGRKVNILVLR